MKLRGKAAAAALALALPLGGAAHASMTQVKTGEHGKSGESHGKSGESHGKGNGK